MSSTRETDQELLDRHELTLVQVRGLDGFTMRWEVDPPSSKYPRQHDTRDAAHTEAVARAHYLDQRAANMAARAAQAHKAEQRDQARRSADNALVGGANQVYATDAGCSVRRGDYSGWDWGTTNYATPDEAIAAMREAAAVGRWRRERWALFVRHFTSQGLKLRRTPGGRLLQPRLEVLADRDSPLIDWARPVDFTDGLTIIAAGTQEELTEQFHIDLPESPGRVAEQAAEAEEFMAEVHRVNAADERAAKRRGWPDKGGR